MILCFPLISLHNLSSWELTTLPLSRYQPGDLKPSTAINTAGISNGQHTSVNGPSLLFQIKGLVTNQNLSVEEMSARSGRFIYRCGPSNADLVDHNLREDVKKSNRAELTALIKALERRWFLSKPRDLTGVS